MENLRLKKLILEVVDNQLRDNDPPKTTEIYNRLMDAGYSSGEAKEKIGAVVIEEIYDVMKEHQDYDKKKYEDALEEMAQKCIDLEDTHKIQTEWDEWDELAEEGYRAQSEHDREEVISAWWKAWDIFQRIVETAGYKTSVSELMESQDYRYPIDDWIQDFELELGNAGEREKHMEFCRKILDLFDWSRDEAVVFKSAIGEELYAAGEIEEGKKWFEDWMKKEPHNQGVLNIFSWCVQAVEGTEAAYKLIRRKVIGVACNKRNELLFMRAKMLADALKKTDDLDWIESQLDSFNSSQSKSEYYGDLYDDFSTPKQPVVKEQKIYPNNPCPCGSGKKYKKCCGRNR